jgi:hypothetical protein
MSEKTLKPNAQGKTQEKNKPEIRRFALGIVTHTVVGDIETIAFLGLTIYRRVGQIQRVFWFKPEWI